MSSKADQDDEEFSAEVHATFDASSTDEEHGVERDSLSQDDDKSSQRKESPLDDKHFNSHSAAALPRPTLSRSHSADAISDRLLFDSSPERPYVYAFRTPRESSSLARSGMANNQAMNAFSSCLPRPTRSDAKHVTNAAADYNFVLDNYVEYADDTKIPRLRGKDVDKLLAAIHSSHPLALCFVVTCTCLLSYSISNHAPHLKADMAQAIVVTLVLATFPEVAASGGTGAFAGMAGQEAIPHYGWLLLLALICSIVWLLFHRYKILSGCGGRLGTCAFLSMNLTVAVFAMPTGAVRWSMYGDTSHLWSDRLEVVPCVLSVVACTAIAAVGGAVRLRSKIPLNPVQVPTTIALLCMLILEPTDYAYTEQIDGGLAVGSFVAMASEQYLATVWDFGAAGFLAGLWILFLDPFFLDFGGKKGFTSFCGFATYVTISKLLVRGGRREETEGKDKD